MARKGNGKATYCVFDSLHGYPVIDDGNRTKLDSKADLFHVTDWSKVDFSKVQVVKFGGAGNSWDTIKSFVLRWNNYNSHLDVNPVMCQVRLYNILTQNQEPMRETELHKFIKQNPDITGLRFKKTDVKNKNEWYTVEDWCKFTNWMSIASLKGGSIPRMVNDMTLSQRNVLYESKQKIRIYDNLFWYLATRFRKSGTCLELNRQEVDANFMVIVSPISESINSYKSVINKFHGFEKYELLESNAYSVDIDSLKADISKKLLSGKYVVLFATWAWFTIEGSKDKTKRNFIDGIDGIKKTFIVVDEFHNSSDTDTSIDVVECIKKFGHAKTLYMSGTPFNELINNSGFNKKGIFNPNALIIYDLGDMLNSDEYSNFRLEHYRMNYTNSTDGIPVYGDCDFEFQDENNVRHEGDKDNTFKRFVEELNVLMAFEERKTSICYMKGIKQVKIAHDYIKKVFESKHDKDNWRVFRTDKMDTKQIIEEVELFHNTHPDGHCVIFTCDKLVMGATILTCDGIHFMRRIGSAEFAVQSWGRTLTLYKGKTSAGIYYYDDKSFWNLYLNFDMSHERLMHERKNDYYKNGAIVFEHIYKGMNQCEMSEQLVNAYLKKYRELASKDSAIDNSIALGFDFDSGIDIENNAKKSPTKGKKDDAFPGENPSTTTQGKDVIPRETTVEGDGDIVDKDTNTKEVSKKEKIIQFIRDNILNYMYFATSMFTPMELNEFEAMSMSTLKCKRHECSLGILFDKIEFDKYINKIRLMKTHIVGEGQWSKMCDSHRTEILTRFKTALEFTKPENYEKTFTIISHKIVTELYEKNQDLIDIQ